jgi:hypothetical protein
MLTDALTDSRPLIAEVQAQLADSAGRAEPRAADLARALQAVQAHGGQNATFGGQGEIGISRR